MIRSLNLDGMFLPTGLTEIKYTKSKFPGGEIHIKLNNNTDYSKIEKVVITHRVNNSDHLMEILLAKDALERKGIEVFDLILPYIPYARQDRMCDEGESFSLKIFSDMINAQKFKKVFCIDAHSDVAPALIDRCTNIENYDYVFQSVLDIDSNDLLLAIPDAGASKKAPKLQAFVAEDKVIHGDRVIPGKPFKGAVQCGKIRKTEDGKLLWFAVHAGDLYGTDCLIVDDICDGGGTFLGLAKELKKHNCGNLYLYVTHGIFSKGFEELEKVFTKIFTTNSVRDLGEYLDLETSKDVIKQFKLDI